MSAMGWWGLSVCLLWGWWGLSVCLLWGWWGLSVCVCCGGGGLSVCVCNGVVGAVGVWRKRWLLLWPTLSRECLVEHVTL